MHRGAVEEEYNVQCDIMNLPFVGPHVLNDAAMAEALRMMQLQRHRDSD